MGRRFGPYFFYIRNHYGPSAVGRRFGTYFFLYQKPYWPICCGPTIWSLFLFILETILAYLLWADDLVLSSFFYQKPSWPTCCGPWFGPYFVFLYQKPPWPICCGPTIWSLFLFISETIMAYLLWDDDLVLISGSGLGLQKQLHGLSKLC